MRIDKKIVAILVIGSTVCLNANTVSIMDLKQTTYILIQKIKKLENKNNDFELKLKDLKDNNIQLKQKLQDLEDIQNEGYTSSDDFLELINFDNNSSN